MSLFRSSVSRAPGHAAAGRQYPWVIPVLSALLAIVLFVASTIYFAYTRLDGNIQSKDITVYLDRDEDDEEDELEPYRPGDDINLLILGSDVRDPNANSDVVGMRSDTTMLAHISADRSRIEIISLPRDTLVDIPSCRLPEGTWTEPRSSAIFNSAFALGGQTGDAGAAAACTIRTVEDLTDLRIDGFVVVNFSSFKEFVEALGGVRMCFEEDLYDRAAALDLKAGCQVLDGDSALAYARARKNFGDGSDIGRMDRQQELVLAIMEDALGKNLLTDLPGLYRLIDAVSQSIVTDSALGNMDTLMSLANSLRGLKTDDVFLMTMPWAPAGPRVLPGDDADVLWDALRDDIPLDTVFDEDGKILVDEPTEDPGVETEVAE